jgi:holin-like protein
MSITKVIALGRRTIRDYCLLQVVSIIAIWKTGEVLAYLTAVPVPGSIVGMLLLLVLLRCGMVDLSSIKRGAEWLLAEILLFFVPAVLAVSDHPEFLGWTGLKILAVILCGTAVVMTCTALTIEMCFRWIRRSEGGTHVTG